MAFSTFSLLVGLVSSTLCFLRERRISPSGRFRERETKNKKRRKKKKIFTRFCFQLDAREREATSTNAAEGRVERKSRRGKRQKERDKSEDGEVSGTHDRHVDEKKQVWCREEWPAS